MHESPRVPAQKKPNKSYPTMQNKPAFTCCPVYLTPNSDSFLVYAVLFDVADGCCSQALRSTSSEAAPQCRAGPRAPGRAGLTRHPAHPARARSRAQGAAGALLINPRHRALPWGTAQHRAEAPCPQQGPAHGWLCCSVTHGQEELACLTDTQMSPIHGVTESFR